MFRLWFRSHLSVSRFLFLAFAPLALVSGCLFGPGDAPLLDCDPRQQACQEGIYAEVAALLDADPNDMPPIRWISVDELRAEIDASLSPADLEDDAWSVAWRLMGFIPDNGSTIAENVADSRADFVWGYYDPDTKSITLVDRNQGGDALNVLLAHELAHAIQDRQFGLDSIREGVETEDAYVSTRSIIEGDATYVEGSFFARAQGFAPTDQEWGSLHIDQKSWLLDRVRDPEERFTDTVSSFPYVYGAEFMTEAHLVGGPSARIAVWESPPRATRTVMQGYGFYVEQSGQTPQTIATHPAPPDGYEQRGETTLGMWYLYAFLLRAGVDEDQAWEVSTALRNDSFAPYEATGQVAAVWRLRFDDNATALAVRDLLSVRRALSRGDVVRDENEVFAIVAETESALAAWSEQPLDEMLAAPVPKSSKPAPQLSASLCIWPH